MSAMHITLTDGRRLSIIPMDRLTRTELENREPYSSELPYHGLGSTPAKAIRNLFSGADIGTDLEEELHALATDFERVDRIQLLRSLKLPVV